MKSLNLIVDWLSISNIQEYRDVLSGKGRIERSKGERRGGESRREEIKDLSFYDLLERGDWCWHGDC